MSLRETFAANLSQLCRNEQSIAYVCRAAKINRQQFSRYLSGDALPNQRNLEKICRHFNIDEQSLFGEGRKTSRKADNEAWSHTDVRAALKLVHSEGPTSIEPGIYFAHYAVPWEKDSVMRSTIVVRRDGNLTTFRRFTGLSERRGSWWSHYTGDHKGIIIERRHWIYLIALNSRGNREPSLIALRWLTNTQPMLGGHAMVMGPPGPIVTAVVVSLGDPKFNLRSAIKDSHVYSVGDPRIQPVVIDALDEQGRSLMARSQYLDLSVREFDAG